MSFTRGVSFHHETNASSQPTINNNISITASNELSNSNVSIEPGEVKYEQVEIKESSNVEKENEFLKKVLALYMNQKINWSGKFVVATAQQLAELIQALLPNHDIDIETQDIEVNCCGASQEVPYDKIESIWVIKDNIKQNFKYCYSNIVALFESYRISIKYVHSA